VRYRLLPLLPLAGAAAVVAAAVLGGAGPRLWWTSEVSAQLASVACCLAAAAAFGRGDYMLRAWTLTALGNLLPALNRLTAGPDASWWLARIAGRPWLDLALSTLVNGFSIAGALYFVGAFWRSGLSLPGSRGRQAAVIGGAIGVALLLGAPVLYFSVQDVLGGGLAEGIPEAIGILGDVVAFSLVAPLFRIALEFRGGVLQWPWGLLAASNLGWLTYDVVALVSRRAGSAGPARLACEVVVVMTYLCAGAAGLAHRWAISGSGEARSAAPAPSAG